MNGARIVLNLSCMGVILCVNDKHLMAVRECDIRLHDWKHIPQLVIEGPGDLC